MCFVCEKGQRYDKFVKANRDGDMPVCKKCDQAAMAEDEHRAWCQDFKKKVAKRLFSKEQ